MDFIDTSALNFEWQNLASDDPLLAITLIGISAMVAVGGLLFWSFRSMNRTDQRLRDESQL